MTKIRQQNITASETPSLAKLSLPRLAHGIARQRLFDLLNGHKHKKAIWITAPGGAGKTTLAATYITEYGIPYLWYQLDKDDADPATLFYYLGLAAKHLSPDNTALPLLTPEYLSDVPGFASRYFGNLYSRLPTGSVIIFDNHHEVQPGALWTRILREAILVLSNAVRLIILSREALPSLLTEEPLAEAIYQLGWNDLRLRLEETRCLVASGTKNSDEDTITTLHRLADGWAAGITLLAGQFRYGTYALETSTETALETVFNYFAREIYAGLPHTMQHFLLCTALVPHVTPSLAKEMTGNKEAEEILLDLHSRHFFVHRRDLPEQSYQYHALLREFLLAQGSKEFNKAEYIARVRKTSTILVAHARQEDAIALCLQAGDWESAVPLLLNQAPLVLAQGRFRILSGWIEALPKTWLKELSWLRYWYGLSQMGTAPFSAQEILGSAYSRFNADSDALGKMLCASAIIDITYFTRQSLLAAEQWLEVIQNEFARKPVFPSPAIEAKVLTSLLSILVYVRPNDAGLPDISSRLLALLESDLDVNQKIVAGSHLMHYYTLVGCNNLICDKLTVIIQPLLSHASATALNQIIWRVLSAPHPTLQHSRDVAYDRVMPLLNLVEDNNLSFMKCLTNVYVSATCERFGDLDKAHALLHRTEPLLNSAQPADIAWHNVSKAIYLHNKHEFLPALDYAKSSLQLTKPLGAIIIEMEIHCLVSIIYCGMNRFDLAATHLVFPRNAAFCGSIRIKREVKQIEAYIYLKTGHHSELHHSLQEAFTISRKQGYFGSWLCWSNDIMAKLCAEALRQGIEADYVRQLIYIRHLRPQDPTVDNWPWPAKIYTLGQFVIDSDQDDISLPHTNAKPLLLLQLIISGGSNNVKVEHICELLWPHAEGDAAISAFTTTVARLRKVIGEDAIKVQDGRATLDTSRCWVDAAALDWYLDSLASKGLYDPQVLETISTRYRGPFLNHIREAWAAEYRALLRRKASQAILQCVGAVESRAVDSEIKRLVDILLHADPGLEQTLRQLSSTGGQQGSLARIFGSR